jgi:hypothetical protein
VPLQNRVTPFGEIVALNQRGLFIGNRGRLSGSARLRRKSTAAQRHDVFCRRSVHRAPHSYAKYWWKLYAIFNSESDNDVRRPAPFYLMEWTQPYLLTASI